MKKIIFPIMVVVIFVAAALGIYFGFTNGNKVDLNVVVKDMTVSVGETVKIKYDCSNKDANVVFESRDS